MQIVSSTLLTALQENTPQKLETVVEFYSSDAVPGEDGFDPSSEDFLFGVASVSGITFMGQDYARLMTSFGDVNRTLKKQLSSFSVTLSNSSREIVDFENATGFEGLICVARLIDRELSEDLADSIVLFTGRCERPDEFDKSSETVKISVKQILGATEIPIPRRKFVTEDPEGRAPSDYEFEGFRYTPREGSLQYQERVRRGGLLGNLLGMKKRVTQTLQFSSHSDLQGEVSVPVILGRVQHELLNFAYIDQGTRIEFTSFICDGHEKGIAGLRNLRSVTPDFPLGWTTLYTGKKGGATDDADHQASPPSWWIAADEYSRTAYIIGIATGTTIPTDDPAPQIVAVVMGQIVPTPDEEGEFTVYQWSDNPVDIIRWILTSDYYFGLSAWMNDAANLRTRDYCDQVLVDHENTDLVQLAAAEALNAGSAYKLYKSSAVLTPAYFKDVSGLLSDDERMGAYLIEPAPIFWDEPPVNGDDPGDGVSPQVLPPTNYRRRYTINVPIKQESKAYDFIHDDLLAAFNGFIVQDAKGRFEIRAAKPADFSFIRTASAEDGDEIKVQNINYWLDDMGLILIGANLATSEVREITGWRYDATVSISISASGGVSASGASLAGGDDDTPRSATLTVGTASGTKTITIDGYVISFTPSSDDTTVTVAGLIEATINSHNILNKYIKAIWEPNTAVVTVESRIGFLELDSALENAHLAAIADPTTAPTLSEVSSGSLEAGAYQVCYSYETLEGETLTSNVASITIAANKNIGVTAITPDARATAVKWYVSTEKDGVRRRYHSSNDGSGFTISSLPKVDAQVEPVYNTTAEEIHRIAMSFVDRANTQANRTASNMLKASFKFPMGGRNSSTNEIKIKYRDSSADFALTELRVKDKAHIAKVKKTNSKEINGSAIDNYHQARRIANQKLAEWRDGDFFHGFSSDGEALLLEEGDVVCVTDESGRFVNEPVRIEEVTIRDGNGYPEVSFVARKYRRYYYDDQIQERLVPLPIVTNSPVNQTQTAPTIYQQGDAENLTVTIGVTDYNDYAKFRKTEVAFDADFEDGLSEIITNVTNEVLGLSPSVELVRTVTATYDEDLDLTVDKWVRVSHSSNGVTWGEPSEALQVTYPDDMGSGGSSGEDPPPTGSGSPPTDLHLVTYDSSTGSGTVACTLNGATGDNIWELKQMFVIGAPWQQFASTAYNDNDADFTLLASGTYTFRVSNTSAPGYATYGGEFTVD